MALSAGEKMQMWDECRGGGGVLHRSMSELSFMRGEGGAVANGKPPYGSCMRGEDGVGSGKSSSTARGKSNKENEADSDGFSDKENEDEGPDAAAPRQQQQQGQRQQQQEVQTAECECCGHREECTAAYVARVKGTYCGHLVCGLCAEAIEEEYASRHAASGSPMRAAVQSHLDMCRKFTTAAKTSPPPRVAVADALCSVLRRHLSVPSTPTGPNSKNLARSTSCLASLGNARRVPLLASPPFPRRAAVPAHRHP